MVQEIDVFLHLVNLCNIFLVQRDQGIHGPGQILTGKRCHAVQLLDNLHYRRSRIEDNFIANIFQLITFPVIHLLILPRYAEAGKADNAVREGEQDKYLEYLDDSMGICHKAALV